MRILVANDDGIHAAGLWILIRELKNIARIIVVAPDREQSAIGTAVTLRQILRVHKVRPEVPEVEAYSTDGTPSDSVILALEKLVNGEINLVIAGINQGLNLGEDVHISGTVGAALQGYLRGFPTLAISAPYGNEEHLHTAARVAVLLAKKMTAEPALGGILLNVNLPDLPLAKITGIRVTRLARESHINSIEEGTRGRQKFYWLVRQKAEQAADNESDIWATEHGYISVTPLYTKPFNKALVPILNNLCADIFQELKERDDAL